MKVVLKDHVMEGTGVKCVRKRNKGWVPPTVKEEEGPDGTKTKRIVESEAPEFIVTPYVKGAVIEMSEESAKKYIEKGWAEPYVDPEAKKEEPKAEEPKAAEVKPVQKKKEPK